MQCTGVGDQPVLTWTITRANPVIAAVPIANQGSVSDTMMTVENQCNVCDAMLIGEFGMGID